MTNKKEFIFPRSQAVTPEVKTGSTVIPVVFGSVAHIVGAIFFKREPGVPLQLEKSASRWMTKGEIDTLNFYGMAMPVPVVYLPFSEKGIISVGSFLGSVAEQVQPYCDDSELPDLLARFSKLDLCQTTMIKITTRQVYSTLFDYPQGTRDISDYKFISPNRSLFPLFR